MNEYLFSDYDDLRVTYADGSGGWYSPSEWLHRGLDIVDSDWFPPIAAVQIYRRSPHE